MKHKQTTEDLLFDISKCTVCSAFMEPEPRPVLVAHPESKIVIVGQAPGKAVYNSGIPWDDKSGANLRQWMDVDDDLFYDPSKVAIIPMGFCYPGTGKSGDLAPRKECAPLWHEPLLNKMPNVQLTLLIGNYAQKYYLEKAQKKTLTATVKNYKEYLPQYFVLPHPSPRNNIWMAKNEWFKQEVIPVLQETIKSILK